MVQLFGLIDMGTTCPDGVTPAHGDTRSFATGTFYIDDAPFIAARTSASSTT